MRKTIVSRTKEHGRFVFFVIIFDLFRSDTVTGDYI